MMFYRLDKNNNIIDSADFKYAEDCLKTDKNIVYDFNGQLVFEEETQNEEYLTSKQNFEIKLDNKDKILKLTQQLEKTDYIANKLIEAENEEERQKLRLQYATQLANRKQWRKEISDLQDKFKELETEKQSQETLEKLYDAQNNYCDNELQEV